MIALRYFELMPYGDEYIIVDPFGINQPLLVSKETALLIYLLALKGNVDEVVDEFVRTTGTSISREEVEKLVDRLDELYLLKNERFENKLREIEESLSKQTFKEFDTLDEQSFKHIEEHFKVHEVDAKDVLGMIVPHMDFRVAMETYQLSYSYLARSNRDIVLVLGVPHGLVSKPLPIMDKHYKLGQTTFKVDQEAIERMKGYFESDIYTDYLAFRNEHSVEFPIAFSYIYKRGNVMFIPTIVSAYEKQQLSNLARSIYQALKEYAHRLFVISSIDLSHVGGKFGDPEPYDTEDRDMRYMRMLCDFRNDEAYELLSKNETRIDGKFTNYLFLELMKLMGAVSGEILDYRVYEEKETNSRVSYASAIFRKG